MSRSDRDGKIGPTLEGSDQNNSNGEGSGTQDAADQNSGNSADGKPAAPQISDIPAIISEDTQSYTEVRDQREQQDLQAQQDMAFWAMLMFAATAITVAITGIGVWLLKRTLDATLEAVEDTGKATDAMVEANEIARLANESTQEALKFNKKMSVIDTRPYLAVEFKGVEFRRVTGRYGLAAIFGVKNQGNGAALDLFFSCKFRINFPDGREKIITISSHQGHSLIQPGDPAHIQAGRYDVMLSNEEADVLGEQGFSVEVDVVYSYRGFLMETEFFGMLLKGTYQIRNRQGDSFDTVGWTHEIKTEDVPTQHYVANKQK